MKRTQSRDTKPEAEAVLLALVRSMSPAEKLNQVRSLSQLVIGLSRRAIERANRGRDSTELDRLFIGLHYGEPLASKVAEYLREGGT